MKFLSVNLESNPLALRIFNALYAIAIAWQIFNDFDSVNNSITHNCSYTFSVLPISSQVLTGVLLFCIIVASLGFRITNWFWLLASGIYFILFKEFLDCQAGSEKVYRAWNHALPFWSMLTLGFQNLWDSKKTIFLIKFLLLFSYFAGGLAKVRHGFTWANGRTLQYYFLQRHADLDTPLAIPIIINIKLAITLSWALLIGELLILLAFFNKKIEYFFVISFFIFQIICWQVIKLKWMPYYGWNYLIYLSLIFAWAYRIKASPKK